MGDAPGLGTLPSETVLFIIKLHGRGIFFTRLSKRMAAIVYGGKPDVAISVDCRTPYSELFTRVARIVVWGHVQSFRMEQRRIRRVEAEALAAVLATCTSLKTLCLGDSTIDDDAAPHLANMLRQHSAITCLEISSIEISEAGGSVLLEGLPACTALARLKLDRNAFGKGGMDGLAAVLPQCGSLAHVDLRYNRIGDRAAEQLAAGLSQCLRLVELDLGVNCVGDDGARALARMLPHCTSL